MQSKRSKKRSAYWRGEKLIIFFRRGIIFLLLVALVTSAVLGARALSQVFPVKNILVSGNYHLDENEIKRVANINDRSLLRLSLDDLKTSIERNAWIKTVVLRKQFPDTIMMNVEEAEPKALLRNEGHMFLLDAGGNILEEIEDSGTPFLPVLRGINPEKDIGGVLEALKLIDALSEKNMLSGKESVEILLKTYGLVLNMDGEYIKVGYGEYAKKLGRWQDLEAEIKKKNITVDYVDLRFDNEVIVKPLKQKKKIKEPGLKG